MRKTLWKWLLCTLVFITSFAVVACNSDDSSSQESASSSESSSESSVEETVDDLASKYEHISIAEAIEIAQAAGQTATTETYVIVGTVKAVENATYGEMTVEDETGELYIYGSMAEDGTYYDKMSERPVKGDTIVLKGVLMTYSGKPQMAAKNEKAVILDWYHPEVEINPEEYEAATVAVVREKEVGSKVQVSGVVAAIAYANGEVPTGVILVDNTASIYVFDKDLAAQVQVGNNVQIAASKTYWVLSTEASNAALYGYKGACQLEEAMLISNDKGNHDFDTSWIEEKTVKEIINTPFSENITTLLYKTTAVVEKKVGTGFVNYYIKDLDGETGSYTYTQCNGSDFDWLDKYDGKVCTVYMTALNAKSAPAECFYRFLPIKVDVVENFVFPEKDIPAFAIEYAVADIFSGETYGANPALELPNGYTNSIVGAEGVTFTYAVNNAEVAELVKGNDITTLNLIKDGTAEVTITANYKNYQASVTKKVARDAAMQITTPTIAEIIAMEEESLVKVRGVVMSSLVNRDGFYLGDETGMIAILTDGKTLGKIKPGDEVVFEGYKIQHKKVTSTSIAGQCAIVGAVNKTMEGDKVTDISYTSDAKLLANYYGDKDYATSYFQTDKTIDELCSLNVASDYTTNVYKLSAKVIVEKSNYYSNIYLQDENGSKKLRLYCSSANQYSWLQAYEGQVVEVELALCNWNDKKDYTGCVISVTVNGEKILNTLNFAK